MPTQAANSNNSSPSRPEEQKENEELNAEVVPTEEEAEAPAERSGVKRNDGEQKEDEELNAEVVPTEEEAEAPAERRGVKRNHGGAEEERKKIRRSNNTETSKENAENSRAAWLAMYKELYGIDPNQYSSLSIEELVAKVEEDVAEAKRKKEERVPPPGEDPTDEIWALPDGILPEIAAWKRNAGLPEKYGRFHLCEGRTVDSPTEKYPRMSDRPGDRKRLDPPKVGCDFARFGENIYACKTTGIVHVCEGQPCSRATYAKNGDLVCTTSARLFHWGVSDSPPRAPLRHGRRWANNGEEEGGEEESEDSENPLDPSSSSEPKDEEEGSSEEEEKIFSKKSSSEEGSREEGSSGEEDTF